MTVNLIGGDWQFTAPTTFGIDAATSINIGALAGSNGATVNIGLPGPGHVLATASIQANEISLFSLDSTTINVNNTFSVFSNGGDVLIGTTGGLNVTIGQLGAGSGQVFLNAPEIILSNIPSASAANVLFFDPGTFQVSSGPASGLLSGTWLVGGNSGLSSPARFGTNDATEVDMYANNALMIALDTVGNVNIVAPLITINTVEFQDGFNVDASTTSNFHGNTTTLNFLSGTGNEVFIQSGWQWLWESGASIVGNSGSTLSWGGGATFSGTTAVNTANFSVTSASNTASLNTSVVNIGASNMGTLNVGNSTSAIHVTAASMQATYSGVTGYNIDASGAGGISIQSTGTAPFLIGSGASGTFSIVNMPNTAAGAGVYTNANIGAGKAYLVIDTTSGLVTSVIPS